jgi:hypothetical protein
MKRAYYSDSISNFLATSQHEIFGLIDEAHTLSSEQSQKGGWLDEIDILKSVLKTREGQVHFEYAIPRMGKRIDVVLLIGPVIFVLEFKIGRADSLHTRPIKSVTMRWTSKTSTKPAMNNSRPPALTWQNTAVWSTMAPLQTAMTEVNAGIAKIDAAALRHETPQGATADKADARDDLEDATFLMCEALGVLAHETADNDRNH